MLRGEIGDGKYGFTTFTPRELQEFSIFTAELILDKPYLAKARGVICDFINAMKFNTDKALFDSTRSPDNQFTAKDTTLKFQQVLIEKSKEAGCSILQTNPSNVKKVVAKRQDLSQIADIQKFMAWYTINCLGSVKDNADARVLETFFMFRNFNYSFV